MKTPTFSSDLLAQTRLLMAIMVGATWLSGCKATPGLDPGFGQDQTYLTNLIERRFTPFDSITRFHSFDQAGRLLQVDYSEQPMRRRYALHHLYEPYRFARLTDPNNTYSFHQFNPNNDPTSTRQYFAPTPPHWFVYEWDTLIYHQKLLLRQNHYDYAFFADYQLLAFRFPLWLTRRSFVYGLRQRLEAYVDSVFMLHDIPRGSVGIRSTPARYLYTNHTRFVYNQQGELSQQVCSSGGEPLEQFRYDNVSLVFNPYRLASSTTSRSWPGQFLSGTTSYSYVYGGDGHLAQQLIDFEDQRTRGVYRSELRYEYSTPK